MSKIVPEAEIARLLAANEPSPAERLIAAALDRRADDNITAVTIEVLPAAPDVTVRRSLEW